MNNAGEIRYNPEVFSLRRGAICFYHQVNILKEDIDWFKNSAYKIYSMNCEEWKSIEQFHKSISKILEFPEYYGSNMNAFEDSLCELDVDGYSGALLVLLGYDTFAKNFPEDAFTILDIIASVSRLYLIDGIKVITLVQTNDRKLSFPPVGCFSISFNLREG